MIPKVIHYCWFGGNPLPKSAVRCIESWKKFLPDYEIKEWNESNFDVNIIPYTAEAYKSKKYAFVSDYARFWILYNYGGLYFDVDVEVIKSFDDIIEKGAFMGCERDASRKNNQDNTDFSIGVNPGLGIGVAPGLGIGVAPGHNVYKALLDYYYELSFVNKDGSLNLMPIDRYTTSVLKEFGLTDIQGIQDINGIMIYPKEYFCPTLDGNKAIITNKTHSIHHYTGTWLSPRQKLKVKVQRWLGASLTSYIVEIKHLFKK